MSNAPADAAAAVDEMTVRGEHEAQEHEVQKQAARGRGAHEVHFVTYNVLSPTLASPGYHVFCNPEHLDAAARLERVKAFLQTQTERGAVIALQEVSLSWTSELLTWAEERGYSYVHATYAAGGARDGGFGVALMYPRIHFALEEAVIERLTETRRWPRDPAEVAASAAAKARAKGPAPSALQSAASYLYSTGSAVGAYLQGVWRAASEPILGRAPEDYLKHSMRRFNQAIALRLRPHGSEESFFVCTYHLPCVWTTPRVMTTHAAMLAQWVQRLAERASCPYVILGDFNVKPSSAVYRMMLSGVMAPDATDDVEYRSGAEITVKTEPAFPAPVWGDTWRPVFEPLRSAVLEARGAEPLFTTCGRVKGDCANFCSTLDYVFVSQQWGVQSVQGADELEPPSAPFPDASHPSDHLPVIATLTF